MSNSQEAFILDWVRRHASTDSVDQKFHEAFTAQYGGVVSRKMFGAQRNHKAMRLVGKMAKDGKLNRFKVSLGGAWQPGFPKWVWSYELAEKI